MTPRTTAYRYAGEQAILIFTLLGLALITAVTTTLTLCTGFLLILLGVGLAYFSTRSHHHALLHGAQAVTPRSAPALAGLADECAQRLQPGPYELFVAADPRLNAYTFGLADPRVVVLYSGLFQEMSSGEIRFILGHEMGHISLGHTWLNSLVGGMAGLPATLLSSLLANAAFLWWNRACEYSADRAGLLVCGKLDLALSALVKLHAGPGGVRHPEDLQRALNSLQTEESDLGSSLGEVFATHPLMLRRIQALRQYAASSDYRRIQAELGPIPA